MNVVPHGTTPRPRNLNKRHIANLAIAGTGGILERTRRALRAFL